MPNESPTGKNRSNTAERVCNCDFGGCDRPGGCRSDLDGRENAPLAKGNTNNTIGAKNSNLIRTLQDICARKNRVAKDLSVVQTGNGKEKCFCL